MPIHPTATVAASARIHPDAMIGPDTSIDEFCVIERDVVIGARCRLEPYVFVRRWTTLGDDNQISAGTALGTDPLDKNFKGERSYLQIGHRNIIREHYTISRGTQPESVTTIGSDNFIMTSGHIAHNCTLGNHIVIASCALVAGHVEVGDRAFLSGGVVVHQWSKIGTLAMVGGNSRVNTDLPPFFLYTGFDAVAHGLNRVGLRRNGVTAAEVRALKAAYRLLYRSQLPLQTALDRIAAELPSPHTALLVEFIRSSRRGIAREARGGRRQAEADAE